MSEETSSQGLLYQKTSQQYNNVRCQFCLCVGIENVVGVTFVPAEHLNDANMAKAITEVGERSDYKVCAVWLFCCYELDVIDMITYVRHRTRNAHDRRRRRQ
jgi:hypothetical protein